MNKSSIEEIRLRFDNDVERFSNLQTGQKTVIDSAISLDLITSSAHAINPEAQSLLDIGCGAGNYTLKMLEKIPGMHCTLIDLSQPMLEAASVRIKTKINDKLHTVQGDIRDIELASDTFDIILAGAVLHHLRTDAEWEATFLKIYQSLRPGGSFWISDLVTHDAPSIHALFTNRYAEYLEAIGGADYPQQVLAYIEREDTPRSLTYQMNLLQKVGFGQVEILHKNGCFATFGAVK